MLYSAIPDPLKPFFKGARALFKRFKYWLAGGGCCLSTSVNIHGLSFLIGWLFFAPTEYTFYRAAAKVKRDNNTHDDGYVTL